MKNIKKIMFVCHGNICRSPMAEFMLKDKLSKLSLLDGFTINSSATSGEEIYGNIGNPVYPPAKRELARHGIFADGKRAVRLKKEDYNNYDLFICMEEYNRKNALRIFSSDPENKVVLLSSFAGLNKAVDDPWYTGDFSVTFSDIDYYLNFLVERLKNE